MKGERIVIRCDYHCHTTYCDGKNTVEEMARAAAGKGVQSLGFSGHGYTFYDDTYCMAQEDIPQYVRDVRDAAARYAGRMEIYLGVEDDLHGNRPAFQRDYTIGSAHEVFCGGAFFSVDNTPEILQQGIREHFGGDPYAMTKTYFESVATVLDVTNCDIIGHFDLVTKFNEGGRLFDESDRRYLAPALEAAEYLSKKGGVFEINTGAMSRGYRTAPYPSRTLLRAIHDFGGAVVLSSDAHSCDAVCGYFADAVELAESCGFDTQRVLLDGKWKEVPFQ